MTSHHVVARVRRILGVRRVGHAGTLDPLATGVLPILVGAATRLAEYFIGWPKTYRFVARLGVSTDTYDADGSVTSVRDPSGITAEQIEAVLQRFRGEIRQRPPAYSAVKREGRRLYSYARAAEPVEVEPRVVHVYRFELIDFRPPDAEFVVECGSGTYVRSLANDVGEALGVGAHAIVLRRLAVGPLTVDDAHRLDDVEAAAKEARIEDVLLAPDSALPDAPRAALGPRESRAIAHGQPVHLPSLGYWYDDGAVARAYDASGRFVAVLRYCRRDARWQPAKVLVPA